MSAEGFSNRAGNRDVECGARFLKGWLESVSDELTRSLRQFGIGFLEAGTHAVDHERRHCLRLLFGASVEAIFERRRKRNTCGIEGRCCILTEHVAITGGFKSDPSPCLLKYRSHAVGQLEAIGFHLILRHFADGLAGLGGERIEERIDICLDLRGVHAKELKQIVSDCSKNAGNCVAKAGNEALERRSDASKEHGRHACASLHDGIKALRRGDVSGNFACNIAEEGDGFLDTRADVGHQRGHVRGRSRCGNRIEQRVEDCGCRRSDGRSEVSLIQTTQESADRACDRGCAGRDRADAGDKAIKDDLCQRAYSGRNVILRDSGNQRANGRCDVAASAAGDASGQAGQDCFCKRTDISGGICPTGERANDEIKHLLAASGPIDILDRADNEGQQIRNPLGKGEDELCGRNGQIGQQLDDCSCDHAQRISC